MKKMVLNTCLNLILLSRIAAKARLKVNWRTVVPRTNRMVFFVDFQKIGSAHRRAKLAKPTQVFVLRSMALHWKRLK